MGSKRSGRTAGWMLASVSAAALALTACSSGGDGSSSGQTEDVELSYALWDENQVPAMEDIIEFCTEEQPGLSVDIELVPSTEYWTKMQTSIASGSGPDVFWMNGPNFAQYAANGALADLGDTGIDTADYPEALVDLYSYDGALYGAPKDFDTIGLWYNKKLFDAAGLEYPNEDWTWEDLQSAAAELTDADAGVWGIAAVPYSQMTYYNTIPQAGGEVISSDQSTTGYGSAEALEGISFWSDLLAAGYSPSAQQQTDTSPFDMWYSDKIAMFYDGSWAGGANAGQPVGDHVDVTRLPAGAAGDQSVVHGLANVANAKSKNLEAAKAFAACASSEEAANIMAETGTVIPAFNGTQQAWVDALPQYNLQIFIDALENAVPYPISKNTTAWTTLETEILAQVWAGAITPQDGLQQLATEMQDALDQE